MRNNTCIIGEPYTLLISSPDAGENSIINIIDHTGKLITQVIGTRDVGSNNVYTVTFTLDESVPVPPDAANDLYSAELINTDGNVIATTTFAVMSKAEPIAHSNDVIAVIGSSINDQIFTEKDYPVKDIKITIYNGNVIAVESTAVGTSEAYGKYFITKYSIPVTEYNGKVGAGDYMMQIVYNDIIEFHPLHMLDAAGIMMVHRMRMDLDKARLTDIDPTLNFSDSDLYHYLMMGVNRFNNMGRMVTQWPLPYLTDSNFGWAVEKLGLIEALEAWSLAEGLKEFSFTGASLSLTVSRKKAIDDMLTSLKTKLPEIQNAKDTWIQQNFPMGFAMGQLSSVSAGIWGPTCPPDLTYNQYVGTKGYGW